jgi:hypothetical protein
MYALIIGSSRCDKAATPEGELVCQGNSSGKFEHCSDLALDRGCSIQQGVRRSLFFNYHFLITCTDSTAIEFGVNEQHRSVVELPFIRLLDDGTTCDNIFFVIAGVCLPRQSTTADGSRQQWQRS